MDGVICGIILMSGECGCTRFLVRFENNDTGGCDGRPRAVKEGGGETIAGVGDDGCLY